MSLFGSLFTGVSGLSSQSQATAMIANNIANVNTVGFKRSEAAFFSLVTTESRSSRYSPGTVSVNRIQRVDQQGPIQSTVSSTDAAISGNGFFPVKRDGDNSALTEYLYTRNGQFSEDAQGFLKNSAGFFLYGWPIDTNGNLPANQGDLTSLVPVDVAFLGGLTRPTTTAELSVNLDASETEETLAAATTSAADFQRGLTVYDSLGSPQPISFQFVKTYGPHGTSAGTIGSLTATTNLITDLGLTPADQFTVAIDGGAVLRTFDIGVAAGGDVTVTTLGDIITDINTNVAGVSAFLGNNGELVIQRDLFTGGAAESVDLANLTGTPLAGLGLAAGIFSSDDLNSATYDNGTPADAPPYSSEEFPAFQNLPGDPLYNSRGWWQVTILDPNNNQLSRGLINFNGDGTVNALPDGSGNIDIELSNINWGNGSEAQSINIDIERFSQFDSDYTVLFSDQNGAELGLRTGIDIDRDGFVIARFSNGATSQLYKLPLVTFANPNGLQEVSGTAYTETEESGEENLREAGSGGAGFLEASTVEISNVDLADEFSRLIITQRAYSANTKVINTVDQMTEELLRLR
ncbi:MAG: flagellar hook-basal body complex protein [Rhodospirillales bacterium]|nr:flagellar hook-basal body complex protein [Alphaproteobacteria bacterium]USO02951.1 MAG: flagellar hook-basal body complex protein [Rhodospirillales bacterium]